MGVTATSWFTGDALSVGEEWGWYKSPDGEVEQPSDPDYHPPHPSYRLNFAGSRTQFLAMDPHITSSRFKLQVESEVGTAGPGHGFPRKS
jgi:hypothetical protein